MIGAGKAGTVLILQSILINGNLFDEYQNNSTVSVIKAEGYFEEGSSDYDGYLTDHRPVYFQFTP